MLHLAEDDEATFLEHVPLRVLFGRSGAGKSAILNGIAAAVSGFPSLAPGRGFSGLAGVVLNVSHDWTAEDGYQRYLSESGDPSADDGYRIDVMEEDPAKVEAERLLQEKIPWPETLPPLLAAAFIGDLGMEEAAESHVMVDHLGMAQTHYALDRVNEQVRLTAKSLIGAGGQNPHLNLIEASDLSAAIEATDAVLRSRHLLFQEARWLEVILDVEEISEETQEAFETLERSSHNWVPSDDWGERVSPLYDVARAWKRRRGRFVQLGWSFTVDCSNHSEYFESWRPDGTGGLCDYERPWVINLGGDAEQSVDDFVEKLTKQIPHLHDRLFTKVLRADSPPRTPDGVSDEEKALFRSGLLARMAPSPTHRRMGDPRLGKEEWDRWMWVSGDGGVRVKPTVETCCTMLERRVNELLPEFLSAHGQVGVFVEPLEQWSVSNRPRLSICLWQGDKPVPLMRVGSGIRRWILSVIDWAFQDLMHSYFVPDIDGRQLSSIEQGVEVVEGLADVQLDSEESLGVLIVDEPELHLDQRLQIQVAEWLKNLKDQGTSVVLASHSPAFLTYQAHEAVLTGVVREGGSPTTIDMTSDLLTWCEEFGSLVGLTTADRILLASGYIVVEGPHDSRVLRQFFSSELEEARVELLHLMGTRDTEQSLIDSEYLTSLGKPIGILLDKIKRNVDEIFRKEEKWLTNEEKFAKRLVRGLRNRGVKHHVTGHIFPDVMCCLPEEAVRKAFPGANFPGWEELGARYSAKRPDGSLKVPPVNYKIFALREMELSIGATDFIDGVLAYCDENAKPHASLRQAMEELLAYVTQPFAD